MCENADRRVFYPERYADDPPWIPTQLEAEADGSAWNDDYEEILAKWRADPANLEPWFCGSIDDQA